VHLPCCCRFDLRYPDKADPGPRDFKPGTNRARGQMTLDRIETAKPSRAQFTQRPGIHPPRLLPLAKSVMGRKTPASRLGRLAAAETI
jgi:hypothetical protein